MDCPAIEPVGTVAPCKTCKGCGVTKSLESFTADGRSGKCNPCRYADRKAIATPEQIAGNAARRKRWKKENPEKHRLAKREQDQRRGARVRKRSRSEIAATTCEQRAQQAARSFARAVSIAAKPWNAPGLSEAAKFKMRYALDPEFNLQQRVRASMRRKRRGPHARIGCRLRAAMVKGGDVSQEARELLGYTAADLKRHIERQFTGTMSWPAYCTGAIHIDHIIPLKLFDLSKDTDLRAAWALSNLRPLWAQANIAKSAQRQHLI